MNAPEPTNVFIVDSKNISLAFAQSLRTQGLNVHIYVANKVGDLTLDPEHKGNSWDSFHRDKELDAIFDYGSRHGGIKAIVIPVSMYLDEEEMESVVTKIRQRNQIVPIVICGYKRSHLQEVYIANNRLSICEDLSLLDGREDSEKAFAGFLNRLGNSRQL